jgi:hypothetical protein
MQKVFAFFLLLNVSTVFSQDRSYRPSLSAGGSGSLFFKDVKQPGIIGRLWLEKLIDRDEARALRFALEHTQMRAANRVTEQWEPTGPTNVTKTFHPSSITTLTFCARKWKDSDIIYGLGVGFGIYKQGYPFFTYSEELLNYQQYQKAVNGWGWANTGAIGYKPGNFEITLNFHSVWDMFHTTNLGDAYDRARSTFVLAGGLSVGYSF